MADTKKILIVDDFESYAQLLQRRLQQEGFLAQYTKDAKSTLDAVHSFEPDLILMDIVMPKMGGFELADIIKANPNSKEVKIIYITGLKAAWSNKKSTHGSSIVIGKSDDFKDILEQVKKTFES